MKRLIDYIRCRYWRRRSAKLATKKHLTPAELELLAIIAMGKSSKLNTSYDGDGKFTCDIKYSMVDMSKALYLEICKA